MTCILSSGGCMVYSVNGTIPPLTAVVDLSSNRVLLAIKTPTSNFQPFDIVIGQPDFVSVSINSGLGSVNSQGFDQPWSVQSDGVKIFVTDSLNHRVLIWNHIPSSNQTAADFVLGQPNMATGLANAGGTLTAQTLNVPRGMQISGSRLFVAETGNRRVLMWNHLPTQTQQAADLVLGQANMTTSVSSSAANGMQAPIGVGSDGTHVFMTDNSIHRVLIWLEIPTVNDQPADVALGQPGFGLSGINNGGASVGMSSPTDACSDGNHLVVADSGNHRVLIWNSIPTANRTADIILGEPDANTTNVGSGSTGFSAPTTINCSGGKLAVGDTALRRVLIWNTFPTMTMQAADLVWGQPDFSSLTIVTDALHVVGPRGFFSNNFFQGVSVPGGY